MEQVATLAEDALPALAQAETVPDEATSDATSDAQDASASRQLVPGETAASATLLSVPEGAQPSAPLAPFAATEAPSGPLIDPNYQPVRPYLAR